MVGRHVAAGDVVRGDRAWYFPTCVNCAMPVTSPIAHTSVAARSRSSTSIPRFEIVELERVERLHIRLAAGGDEQAVERSSSPPASNRLLLADTFGT